MRLPEGFGGVAAVDFPVVGFFAEFLAARVVPELADEFVEEVEDVFGEDVLFDV